MKTLIQAHCGQSGALYGLISTTRRTACTSAPRTCCSLPSCSSGIPTASALSSHPAPPKHGFNAVSLPSKLSRQFHVQPNQAIPPHLAVTTALFTASTVMAAAVGLLMIFFPHWHRTKQIIQNPWSLAPIAVAYGILLAWSWQPDTFSLILPGSWEEGFKGGFNPQFFPSLAGIVTLFSRVATAASLWVHILAINLFAARELFLDGLDSSVPTWHTIILCMTVAPLGFISHALTKRISSWRSRPET